MATIHQLPVPKSGLVNHICHISDIHIRAGTENKDAKSTRYDEYMNVFSKITTFLEANYSDSNDMVICITGDIVHDNRKAGAPCIELFYEIMHRLGAIAPVYIIRGNHDYNQASISPQDMLTSLMHGLRLLPNIVYLSQTGLYQAANVGFGLVAIQDVLIPGDTCGRVENLPSFPSANSFPKGVNTRIALFHGDVPNVYPLDWFGADYDYILLGDVHRMQIYNANPKQDTYEMESMPGGVLRLNTYTNTESESNPIWGYPGSTIQQNFGESLIGHGFMMWDLASRTVDTYHVPNDYGYITMQSRNKQLVANMSFSTNDQIVDCFIEIGKAIKQPWFPNVVRLRIKAHKHELGELSVVDFHKILQDHKICIESSNEQLHDTPANPGSDNISSLNISQADEQLSFVNDPEAWCSYIKEKVPADALAFQSWESWFKSPTSLMMDPINVVNEHITKDVNDRNMKIHAALEEFNTTNHMKETMINCHTKFELLYMNWAYILCFQNDCFFDFKDLKGRVHCISGKNGYGKTSFLESICIAMFGEGFPSRCNKSYSAALICQQTPTKSRAFTSIVFDIDNITYRIKRTFEHQGKEQEKLHSKDIVLEKYDTISNAFASMYSGKKATSEWISKYVGTVDAFLTSCIITQSFDEDFFTKKTNDQKLYLEKQLALNSSSAYLSLLKTAHLAYADVSKKIRDYIDIHKSSHQQFGTNPGELDHVMSTIKSLNTNIDELEARQRLLKETWQTMTESVLAKGKITIQAEHDGIMQQIEKQVSFMENKPTLDELIEKRGCLKSKHALECIDNKCLAIVTQDDIDNHMKCVPQFDKPLETVDYLKTQIAVFESKQSTLEHKSCELLKIELNDTQMKLDEQRTMLLTKESELQSEQKRLTTLANQKTPPPKYTLEEYMKWNADQEQYKIKYPSIDVLKSMMDDCKQPSVHRPSLTEQEMLNATVRINRWLLNVKTTTGTDGTMTELETMLSHHQNELSNLNTSIAFTEKQYEVSKAERTTIEEALAELQNDLHILLENRPVAPAFKLKEERDAEYAKYVSCVQELAQLNPEGDYTRVETIVKSYSSHSLELHALQKRLRDERDLMATSEKHDFNPKCKACMSHPWKQKMDKCVINYRDLETKYDCMKQQMIDLFGTFSMSEDEYERAKTVHALKQEHDILVMFWNDQVNIESQYNAWLRSKLKLETNIMNKKKELKTKTVQCEVTLWKELEDMHKARHTHEQAVSNLNKFTCEWAEEIDPLLSIVEVNRQAHILWNKWDTQFEELSSQYSNWKTLIDQGEEHHKQVQVRDTYNKWNDEWTQATTSIAENESAIHMTRDTIEILVGQLQCINESLFRSEQAIQLAQLNETYKQHMQWDEWESKNNFLRSQYMFQQTVVELADVEEQITNVKQLAGLNESLSKLREALQVIDAYDSEKHVNSQLQRLYIDRVVLHNQKEQLIEFSRQMGEMQRTTDMLESTLELMTTKLQTIEAIEREFSKFKDWVLEYKVIPMIVKNVNGLLKVMCTNHRPLFLTHKYDSKGVFNWLLMDGDNTPPLEKASGFQQFVISLAMRIVLGKLGVAGIKNTQLFIDEGFTACDTDNLSIIPLVLNDLLRVYKAIIIVSHLDDLKHNISSFINISRNQWTGLSQIQFGEQHDIFTTHKKQIATKSHGIGKKLTRV